MDIRKKYNIGGRPVKFKSPEEMLEKIYEYLSETDGRTKQIVTKGGQVVEANIPAPVTVEGFCAFAGITKTTFYDYRTKKPFKPIIEQFRQIVESYWVGLCAEGQSGNKADFVLKNAFSDDWKDKTINEHDLADGLKTSLVTFVSVKNEDGTSGSENSGSVPTVAVRE